MKKKISVGAAVIIACVSIVVAFMSAYIILDGKYRDEAYGLQEAYRDKANALEEKYARFEELFKVDERFRELYIGEIDEDELINMTIAGYLAGTGDRYAAYYDEDAIKELTDDLQGELCGIGVQVIYNADYKCIEVISVIPDSPALEAGVLPGDLIVYIGNKETAVSELGYENAVNRLKGEVGTKATFTVYRGDDYSEELYFEVVRAKITNVSVTSHVYALDPTVGVIKISEFDATTPPQFKAAVEELKGLGCTRLIVDVRNNPGGELNSICEVLDYLLPEGPVVRTVDKDGNETVEYISDADMLGMPINVLVNGNTASAAELFASALQDYKVAKIVGVQTYGKGSMQVITMLDGKTAVKVTYKKYSPPFSDNYDGIGVTPDIVEELDEALSSKNPYKITDEEDNVLRAAYNAFE